MNFTTEKNRIYYETDGKLLAEITFIDSDETSMTINHTFVDDNLRGQGIASQLVQAAVNEIKKQHKQVKATCSYAVNWLTKHPDAA